MEEAELRENFEKDALFYEGTHNLQKIINTAVLLRSNNVFFFFRATRQREIKRTTPESGIANATNTTNIAPANNLNTDTSINCENVKSAKSALDSNNLDTLDVVEDSKGSAMIESSGLKEETKEWPKKEEPKTETPEKKIPITPKGKYELRASTLMPRNYEIKDEDDDEEDEKKDDKNVEAVIDLTEDDDAPVVTNETLDKKDGPSMHT